MNDQDPGRSHERSFFERATIALPRVAAALAFLVVNNRHFAGKTGADLETQGSIVKQVARMNIDGARGVPTGTEVAPNQVVERRDRSTSQAKSRAIHRSIDRCKLDVVSVGIDDSRIGSNQREMQQWI